MKGNHPKRRKDKYNPYKICEWNGHYYIEFKDSENKLREMEISRELYEAFSSFELRDISYLHKWDKYIEHSEVTDIRRDNASNQTTESVEDIVLRNMEIDALHRAIQKMTEVQKRRVLLYFFEDMTYDQIAVIEGCTKMPVKRSIDQALQKLKKELEK